MSLVNHGACPFDRTDPPSALVVGLSPNQDEMSGQTKIGFMQLQLEGSLYKTLILKFYGNAQGGRPRPAGLSQFPQPLKVGWWSKLAEKAKSTVVPFGGVVAMPVVFPSDIYVITGRTKLTQE